MELIKISLISYNCCITLQYNITQVRALFIMQKNRLSVTDLSELIGVGETSVLSNILNNRKGKYHSITLNVPFSEKNESS